MDVDAEFWSIIRWHEEHRQFVCRPLFSPFGAQLLLAGPLN